MIRFAHASGSGYALAKPLELDGGLRCSGSHRQALDGSPLYERIPAKKSRALLVGLFSFQHQQDLLEGTCTPPLWLFFTRIPANPLVGVGSMCRRHVHGANGILEVVEALDGVLPAHVRLHLFGIKSEALRALAHHPRVAAVDSMAWDMRARAQRRTGRDMQFRIDCMDQWLETQVEHLDAGSRGAGIQRSLLDPAETGPITDVEAVVIEAVAMQWAEMLVGNEWTYRSAVHHCRRDAAAAIAIFRHQRGGAQAVLELEDLFEGVGERVEQMLGAVGELGRRRMGA